MTYRYRGTGKSDPKLDKQWEEDQKKKGSWKPGKKQQRARETERRKARRG